MTKPARNGPPPPDVTELYRRAMEDAARQAERQVETTPRRRRDTRTTKAFTVIKEWKNVPITLGMLGAIAWVFSIGIQASDRAKTQVIEQISVHDRDVASHEKMLDPWKKQCSAAYQKSVALERQVTDLQKALAELREKVGTRRRRR